MNAHSFGKERLAKGSLECRDGVEAALGLLCPPQLTVRAQNLETWYLGSSSQNNDF